MPSNKKKNKYPFVSVCTPTFNRRPFIENMFRCFLNQNYPKDRIEWIIVDDGTDKIRDLIESSGISNIKYFALDKKMALGEKRNYMHKQAKGSIIVYMDDDDYYPPERIEHAVDKLQKLDFDNIVPMLRLVEMARTWNVRLFVFMSTTSVYGKIVNGGVLDERSGSLSDARSRSISFRASPASQRYMSTSLPPPAVTA